MTEPALSAPLAGVPGAASTVQPGEGRMRAIVQIRYGAPEDLALQDVDKPLVGANDLLVRVRASAANAGDWRLMRGEPYSGGVGTFAVQIARALGANDDDLSAEESEHIGVTRLFASRTGTEDGAKGGWT